LRRISNFLCSGSSFIERWPMVEGHRTGKGKKSLERGRKGGTGRQGASPCCSVLVTTVQVRSTDHIVVDDKAKREGDSRGEKKKHRRDSSRATGPHNPDFCQVAAAMGLWGTGEGRRKRECREGGRGKKTRKSVRSVNGCTS